MSSPSNGAEIDKAGFGPGEMPPRWSLERKAFIWAIVALVVLNSREPPAALLDGLGATWWKLAIVSLSIVCFVLAFGYWAMSKGRSSAWGFLGIVPPLALVFLWTRKPHQKR
jgi:hypothetical protein